MTETKKKKNIFKRFFSIIGKGITYFFTALLYYFLYIIAWPFTRCKVKGKENLQKDDEARVVVSNHYQMYGPLAIFMNFPYKFRPWIIDKMMEEEHIEHQMGLMVYNEFKKVPKFIIWIVLKIVKNLMLFCMHKAGGISVSRENPRKIFETLKISTETLEKNKIVLIFPEKDYVNEGVGIFMQGFEHIGKYHYQKTGKKISFYPMFVSQSNKTMYILKPIIFDPDEDANVQKQKIVKYLRDEMVKQYELCEVNNEKIQKKKAKKRQKKQRKELKTQQKRNRKLKNKENISLNSDEEKVEQLVEDNIIDKK
ncbi:MAG: hypothetical protein IJX17_04325 [Clostridia bacterium]|nr:hypothetical protein [Clostridia bacterium]